MYFVGASTCKHREVHDKPSLGSVTLIARVRLPISKATASVTISSTIYVTSRPVR